MGIFSGPKSTAPGLLFVLDASNIKSYPGYATVRLLIVGGGGGGGMDMGGGGGGGQVISKKFHAIQLGTDLPVLVGRGGYGAPAGSGGFRTDGVGPQPGSHQFTVSATAGEASSFAGLTAAGGGFGASSYFQYTPNFGQGGSGFNGGGASGYSDGNTGRAGAGSVNLGGYNGGGSGGQYYSGGGGGSDGPGISGTARPDGGPGKYDDILGTGYYWGGGGGGGSYSLSQGGNGGIGGGGGGAIGSTSGGSGYNNGSPGGGGGPNQWAQTPGGNGGANTGGGGGGGSHYNANNKGGEGGSGIVVIRYPGPQKGVGGNIITTVGSDTVHIFTSNGTFKLFESTNTYTTDQNILTWANWSLGSGGTSGYGRNGDTNENERVTGVDPWGASNVVWESRPSGNGEADGGWNTDWFNIDKTKKYRFSVWMKRTSNTAGGIFYLGMYSNGSGARQMSDGAYNGNPYWICWGTGNFTQNQWYLFVGHVYPYETTYTGLDPDSGYYTRESGKIGNISCNIGSGDLKWPADATQGIHRTYHFYCNDSTTRLQFYQPRVDVCDGTEPSIKELLDNRQHTWYDSTGNGYNGILSPKYPTKIGNVFQFNGSNNMQIPNVNLTSGSYTIITVARYSGATRGRMITSIYNNWLLGHWAGTTENYYAEGWVSNVSSGAGDTTWRVLAATGNTATDIWQIYVNGILTFSNNAGSAGPNGLGICSYNFALNELSTGECAYLAGYNRVLTADEIKDATFSLRTKFGF
jgi:hypothetical protein